MMGGTCVCRHGEAQHGIEPVLGEQDGRTVVTGWTETDNGGRCVWADYPELSVNPQTGQTARPCPCEGFTPKEGSR